MSQYYSLKIIENQKNICYTTTTECEEMVNVAQKWVNKIEKNLNNENELGATI
jgi:hypothetical protein